MNLTARILTGALKVFVFIILTALSQIGGLLFILSLVITFRLRRNKLPLTILIFIGLYCCSSFWIVPAIAPIFGREPIKENVNLQAHSFITKMLNRHYVSPDLNATLSFVSDATDMFGIKIRYLDANFPFITGFPLFPHNRHNNGKKIDIDFLYETNKGRLTKVGKSNSGYGDFNSPKDNEPSQPKYCHEIGYNFYGVFQYFTFGQSDKSLIFSEKFNAILIKTFLTDPKVKKIYIEPHLRLRLELSDERIEFHGCHSFRHDDHFHVEVH